MPILNQNEIANFFGVTRQSILDWTGKGCPFLEKPEGRGKGSWKFDSAAVANWRLQHERAVMARTTGDTTEEQMKLRIKAADLLRAESDAAYSELELQIKRGEFVALSEIGSDIEDRVARCRARLLSIPKVLASPISAESDPVRCEELIRNPIFAALTELSHAQPEV